MANEPLTLKEGEPLKGGVSIIEKVPDAIVRGVGEAAEIPLNLFGIPLVNEAIAGTGELFGIPFEKSFQFDPLDIKKAPSVGNIFREPDKKLTIGDVTGKAPIVDFIAGETAKFIPFEKAGVFKKGLGPGFGILAGVENLNEQIKEKAKDKSVREIGIEQSPAFLPILGIQSQAQKVGEAGESITDKLIPGRVDLKRPPSTDYEKRFARASSGINLLEAGASSLFGFGAGATFEKVAKAAKPLVTDLISEIGQRLGISKVGKQIKDSVLEAVESVGEISNSVGQGFQQLYKQSEIALQKTQAAINKAKFNLGEKLNEIKEIQEALLRSEDSTLNKKNVEILNKKLTKAASEGKDIENFITKLNPIAQNLQSVRQTLKIQQQTEKFGQAIASDIKNTLDPFTFDVLDVGPSRAFARQVEREAQQLALNKESLKDITEQSVRDGLETLQQALKNNRDKRTLEKFLKKYIAEPTTFGKLFIRDKGKQLLRAITPTVNLYEYMQRAGDKSAKLMASLLDKSRAVKLEIEARYFRTPNGPRLLDKMDALGIQQNTTASRAAFNIAESIGLDTFVKDAAKYRENPEAFQKLVTDSLNKIFDKKISNVKVPAEKEILLRAKIEELDRVNNFFERPVSREVADEAFNKGIGDVSNFRREYDKIPFSYIEATKKVATSNIREQVAIKAKFETTRKEFLKQGIKQERINRWDTLIARADSLSRKAQEEIIAKYERYTPRHFDLFADIAKTMRQLAKEEGTPIQNNLPGYVQHIVPKANKPEKSLEELLKLPRGEELLNEVSASFFKRRYGNLNVVRDLRLAVESRVQASARYQSLVPLREQIELVGRDINASRFTKDVTKDLALRIFNKDTRAITGNDTVDMIYGLAEQGFRNYAGQVLGTVKFAGLNALQSAIFFAENPSLLISTTKFLTNPKNWTLVRKSLESTGATTSEAVQEWISGLTGIQSKRLEPGAFGKNSLSKGLEDFAEKWANYFAKADNKGAKFFKFILENPALTGSEAFNKMVMSTAGLLKHFKGDVGGLENFLSRVSKGSTVADRRLFNNIVVNTIDRFGFVMNSELNRTTLQSTPGLNLLSIYTTFPMRLTAKFLEWAGTNPQALINYLTFTSTVGGIRTLGFMGGVLDGATSFISNLPFVDKRFSLLSQTDIAEVESKFEKGDLGKGFTGAGADVIANLRKAGKFLQDKALGTDLTVGGASLANDISFNFALNTLKSFESLGRSPEEAILTLLSLNDKTLLFGFPEIRRIVRNYIGVHSDTPEKSIAQKQLEGTQGITGFDPTSQRPVQFPTKIFNQKLFTANEETAQFFKLSRRKEQINNFAGAVLEITDLKKKMENLRFQKSKPDVDVSKLKDKYYGIKAERDAKIRALTNAMHNSGLFKSKETVEQFLNEKQKSVEDTFKRQKTVVRRAEDYSKFLKIKNPDNRFDAIIDTLVERASQDPTFDFDAEKKAILEKGLLNEFLGIEE